MTLTMSFTRSKTQASRVVEATQTHFMTLEETTDMLFMLRFGNVSTVMVPDAFSRFIHLGPDNPALIYTPNNPISLNLTLVASDDVITVNNRTFPLREWWQMEQDVGPNSIFVDPNDNTDYRVLIVEKSDLIAAGVFGSFVQGGVIGLYLTIVLAVGKFLRVYVESSSARIIYEELKPNVDGLLSLVVDLQLSRQSSPPDLVIEEELYNELVQLYRSPEALIEATKLKRD